MAFNPPRNIPNKNVSNLSHNQNASPLPVGSASSSPMKNLQNNANFDQNGNTLFEENNSHSNPNSALNQIYDNNLNSVESAQNLESNLEQNSQDPGQMSQASSQPAQQPSFEQLDFNPLGPTLPLSKIIESAIQKSFHELTLLADILPSNTDSERKIKIVEYAVKNRQILIRLLALVKWAQKSARKVEKCSHIISILDKQSNKYIETSDRLHFLANMEIKNYPLPNFAIPSAIDVLTTGAYPRLPACIVDKVINEDDQALYIKNTACKSTDITIDETIDEISNDNCSYF